MATAGWHKLQPTNKGISVVHGSMTALIAFVGGRSVLISRPARIQRFGVQLVPRLDGSAQLPALWIRSWAAVFSERADEQSETEKARHWGRQ